MMMYNDTQERPIYYDVVQDVVKVWPRCLSHINKPVSGRVRINPAMNKNIDPDHKSWIQLQEHVNPFKIKFSDLGLPI